VPRDVNRYGSDQRNKAAMDESVSKPTEAVQPIDAATLLDRCMGDAVFLQRVLEKFRSSSDAMLNTIAQAVHDGDKEKMGRGAHSLKGAAANLSAEAVRSIAGRLQDLAHGDDLSQAEQSLSELKQELDRCIAYIPTVIEQVQPPSADAAKRSK
jgi:HPt (histidine-containing phosphotransfer) domain-containing protein